MLKLKCLKVAAKLILPVPLVPFPAVASPDYLEFEITVQRSYDFLERERAFHRLPKFAVKKLIALPLVIL